MKNRMKKYVAGAFMGIALGIHSLYQYLPQANNVTAFAQDSISLLEEDPTTSIDDEVATASSTEIVVISEEPRPVVLIATTSSTVAPTPPPPVTSKPVVPVVQPPLPPKSSAINGYTDGTYVGTRENAYYGYVQVQLTFKDGVITDAIALESPSKQRESQKINTWAIPKLQTETIAAQSDSVDTVSGATYTSKAFKKSIASAIGEAKA